MSGNLLDDLYGKREQMEYKLVQGIIETDGNSRQFDKDVNTAISEGWELQGGIAISKPFIYQAVVKK